MEQFLAYLNAIRPISDSAADYLRKVMKAGEFKKKSLLVRAGRINNNFYFIIKGLVRSYYMKRTRQVSIWFLMENDVIASTESYRTQRPSIETMQAIEDCTVVYASFDELENLYRLSPEMEHHGRIVTQKYSTLWYSLLNGIRMQTARERYLFLLHRFPELLQRVPAKYLASYLDISEFTLSKIRGRR